MRCLLLCALVVVCASSAVVADTTLRDELVSTARVAIANQDQAARQFYLETFRPRLIAAARATAAEGSYSCAFRVTASECGYNDCLSLIIGTLFADDPSLEGFSGRRGSQGVFTEDIVVDGGGAAWMLHFDWE